MIDISTPPPEGATALLLFSNGQAVWGRGIGSEGIAIGEICFNTAMTGYQEILTDPSYCKQIITFTAPHIGNVGTNPEDWESRSIAASGLVIRDPITAAANYRSNADFNDWLAHHNTVGICGVDTRALTHKIRDSQQSLNVLIAHSAKGSFDLPALLTQLQAWPGLNGLDLTHDVSVDKPFYWQQTTWQWNLGYGRVSAAKAKVICIDYGIKYNILRCLSDVGCDVEVVPCTTSADDILRRKPDGIFLSNGPGDPFATGRYALPEIQRLLASGVPIFGICLGFQLLALALGAKSGKMALGHHGANHPVKDLRTGRVYITSQNHGFQILADTLPAHTEVTHVSLFDGSLQGFRCTDKPVMAVQGHPEASPGPQEWMAAFMEFRAQLPGLEKVA